jgi:hypothetical protein
LKTNALRGFDASGLFTHEETFCNFFNRTAGRIALTENDPNTRTMGGVKPIGFDWAKDKIASDCGV